MSYSTHQLQTISRILKINCTFDTIVELSQINENPKFVFAHILLPHAPYIFGPNGENVDSGNIIKSNVKSYIGLELSKHAAEYSKNKFDLNIANESTGTFLNKNKNFDVIIMSDVIEHLDNPFEILQLIEKNLNPNGILIFSTFNMNSITPKIMGKRYHWIMPMHKYYFSNDTLKYFLNKYNLNLFKTKTDTRLISLEYLLNKMVIIMPKIDFIFKFLLKFNFLRKLTIKINLLDLNIYFVKKHNIR